jgi:thiamine biosynthesis protein ThiS
MRRRGDQVLITIHLNGEWQEVPEGLTVASLLVRLQLPADRVAVERNREILPRDRWSETHLQPDDRLEVVHFVGGGSSSAVGTGSGRKL